MRDLADRRSGGCSILPGGLWSSSGRLCLKKPKPSCLFGEPGPFADRRREGARDERPVARPALHKLSRPRGARGPSGYTRFRSPGCTCAIRPEGLQEWHRQALSDRRASSGSATASRSLARSQPGPRHEPSVTRSAGREAVATIATASLPADLVTDGSCLGPGCERATDDFLEDTLAVMSTGRGGRGLRPIRVGCAL